MKYKIGDKVKIKTWEEMEKEFGLLDYGSGHIRILCPTHYLNNMEKELNKLNCNRILTIKRIEVRQPYHYLMEEMKYIWTDEMIKELVEEVCYPILNRYEILDLRGYS